MMWQNAAEIALQPLVRPVLREREQLARFEHLRGRYAEVCARLLGDDAASNVSSDGYDWSGWAGRIRAAFLPGVPLAFLREPTLRYTMVFGARRGILPTRLRLRRVLEAFGADLARTLEREDYLGLPTITDPSFLTSANRTHHAAHLAEYAEATGSAFWSCRSIIEWGGGYGNMARLIRRMSPQVTYTIIDLPELLALQWVYLGSLEGEDQLNVIAPGEPLVLKRGKINLVSSRTLLSSDTVPTCDGFLSTWALTESPRAMQEWVLARRFFGASRLLLAYARNGNNVVADGLDAACARVPVPVFSTVGPGNEYGFR